MPAILKILEYFDQCSSKHASRGYKRTLVPMQLTSRNRSTRNSTDTPAYVETSPLLGLGQKDTNCNMSKANTNLASKQVSDEQRVIKTSVSFFTDGGDEKNPFLHPDVSEYWRQTYEKSQYECRHVFDPTLTWSEEEEKRLIRRLDWMICLWAVRKTSFISMLILGI